MKHSFSRLLVVMIVTSVAPAALIADKANNPNDVTINTSGSKVALPRDFPKDVPIHPKGVVKMVSKAADDLMVGILAPVSQAEAADFYLTELRKLGWKSEGLENAGDMLSIDATKGKRLCQVTVQKDNDKGSFIQLALSASD